MTDSLQFMFVCISLGGGGGSVLFIPPSQNKENFSLNLEGGNLFSAKSSTPS